MRLESNLGHIAGASKAAVGAALLQTAADIVDLTKQLTPVDTGNLQSSYGAVPLSSSEIAIGTQVEYAPYVEFGTSKMSAQPHLRPAFLQSKETFAVRLAEAIEKL